jgi:DegV family protein with EDD domain
MSNIHIVTDSCASFVNRKLIQQYPVTIIPNKLIIGGKTYRDGIDISNEDVLNLMERTAELPQVIAPSIEDIVAVYARAAHTADTIVSIHASRELFPIWQRARTAAQQMIGHCELAVVDSRTLCAAQGLLVNVAIRTMDAGGTSSEVIAAVRSAVERTYSLYYVESLTFLRHNELMSRSHVALGTMLGVKPFIGIEQGLLVVNEKVKTWGQAVDRLVEFAEEFDELEDGVIIQSSAHSTDHTRNLQDRLSVTFSDMTFPYTVYSPALAVLIGIDATGVVILEKEMEHYLDDDFED